MNARMLTAAFLALLAALATWGHAQEPAAERQPAEAQLAEAQPAEKQPAQPEGVPAELRDRYERMAAQLKEELPTRDFKVETVPAQKVPLTRPDARLLENKFVARLELVFGGVDPTNSESVALYLNRRQNEHISEYPEPIKELLRHGEGFLIYIDRVRATDDSATAKHLAALAVRCPPAERPDERLVKALTTAEGQGSIRLRRDGIDTEGRRVPYVDRLQYLVLAPTAEEAELRAEAIVRLYDGGFSRPMQQYLFGQGQPAYEKVGGKYQELAQLKAAIQAESDKLAKPSEISSDILSQLKAQKVMVAVELAGLSARVKACDAMLADPKKLEISTLQSISDMKVKAEIERVGIKEKLDQINTFIAEGDSRQAASTKRLRLLGSQRELQRDISAFEQFARTQAELFELYAPFRVPDNQISVGPIEWTNE